MKKLFVFGLVAVLSFTSCKKDETPAPVPGESEFYQKLKKIPQLRGITAYTQDTTKYNGVNAFSEVYYADFVQPLDHNNPSVDSLYQRLIIHFAGDDRPVVLYTGGYELDEFGRKAGKPSCAPDLACYLQANYITVEYRYFGSSTPKNLFPDANWTYLTSDQASADLHEIYEAFRTNLFPSVKWVSSGCSKGGITSTMYAKFYPTDMNLYLPFCAPFMKIEQGAAYNSDARIGRFMNWTGEFSAEGVANAELKDKMIKSQEYLFSVRPEMSAALHEYGSKSYKEMTVEKIKEAYNNLILNVFESHLAYSDIKDLESNIPKSGDDYQTTVKFICEYDENKDSDTKSGYTPAKREDLSDNAYWAQVLKELGYFKTDISPFAGKEYGSEKNKVTENDSFTTSGTNVEQQTITFDPTLMNTFHSDFLSNSKAKVVFIYGQNDFWTGAGVTKAQADANPNFRWRKITGSNHTDSFLKYPQEADIQAVKQFIDEFVK